MKEFIVETIDGRLYHLEFKRRHFWTLGGRFSCTEIPTKSGETHQKNIPVLGFGFKGMHEGEEENLKLSDLKGCENIVMNIGDRPLPEDPVLKITSKIKKIFERIQ